MDFLRAEASSHSVFLLLVEKHWQILLAVLLVFVALVILGRRVSRPGLWSLALLPAAVVVGAVVYDAAYPWKIYRYTLSVDLKLDGRARSKSETYEVRTGETPLMCWLSLGAPGCTHRTDVFGQALYFDLEGAPFLITMAGSGGAHTPTAASVLAYDILRFGPLKLRELPPFKGATAERLKASVPIDRFPYMITFDDPADPNSLRLVDRDRLSHDLRRDVSITSASIQMTTERPGPFDLLRQFPGCGRSTGVFQARRNPNMA